MLMARLPRRAPWGVLRAHLPARAVHSTIRSVGVSCGFGVHGQPMQQLRAFSSGMDAFMEFEREMAMKRRLNNPTPTVAVRRERPIPPKDDECCKLDCPNCVLLVYQEQLLDYELSLQARADTAPTKPTEPEPKYTIAFLDAEPSAAQKTQMQQNDKLLYGIARNELISEPHTTKDGFERSVRHIDLHVTDDQRELIGEDASNIAVFVPNDADLVNRAVACLQVDPDLVFTVAPLRTEQTASGLHISRPFDAIGSVREALTWSLDLVSTPRPSFLRHLAAYSTDDLEVEALMAPTAIETIEANRPGQRITLVDILEMFPSVQLDFGSLHQFAPQNAPRYYTVSSSRRLYPDTVSITLGLRKLASQPTPRCSSYLASLVPGADSVRATFFKSSFVFPHDDRRPLMLISAGTGIAPFRAFLQDLEHEQEASGEQNHREAYLFYGCRRRELDYLYGDDMDHAHARGYLDQLFVEFSDVPGQPKRYVQDALAEQRALVARHLVDRGGYVFVCGSLAMGRAVKHAIVDALSEHSHFRSAADAANADSAAETDAAKQFLTDCLANGRVVTELW